MKKALLALALLVSATGASYAQTTAAQSDIGYLSTSGCLTGQTVCFLQYGATIPVSGTITPSGTQDVNITQTGGVTQLRGSGATGTGSERVTVAVDSATVAGSASLPVGGNIVGKVGIDQTTPGTTNGVQVNAALPAGSNVIGHVIADTGSTTAVTGNVTVVQPTGSNLHAVLDTTSTTAVTQATAANLNATIVGTGTFADQSTTTPGQRTLVTLDIKTVTTGGVAVSTLSAGHRTAGGLLCNPQGATVNLGVNEIGTAAGTTSSGDTTFIIPGQCYRLTPASTAVSVITSDSAHPFSGYGLN